ncbi:MAG TPA: adenylate/guanylate cyclase domain-containing protein [Ferruginibacter sp.]|nr:adenylate/guanylate cyclase domain-containing protein [Ferruginibacter sp.]
MEENLAILIADLSGYTALTETHGSTAAADLIDKYLQIVQVCLVGDSKLHERTGDEVMIVSSSADAILSTTLMIGKNMSNEENFLQVHGGLHYGNVLKRANNYFGSTINLTSRIAAQASPGKFWCSAEYVNALADKSVVAFESKGNHLFKNISEEIGIYELQTKNVSTFYIDPVCRMLILDRQNAIPHPDEDEIYFCSSVCLSIYNTK